MTLPSLDPSHIVYRWDLDKTYLRTEFDSLRDLLRTAAEPVGKKKTVPGALTLLREQGAAGPRGVFILSGSPDQMRPVLEAKLQVDGIRWDGFALKPSLRNLLRGRFRYVRDQVGYKLGVLFASRKELAEREAAAGEIPSCEVLFGDDAEADAFVYSLYADVCAGRLSAAALAEVLEEAGVYPDDRQAIVHHAGSLSASEVVRLIFIHLDRVSPVSWFAPYGARVCPIYNYFQSACVLLSLGALSADAALRVGAELLGEHAFGPDALLASLLDVARRVPIGRPAGEAMVAAIARLGPEFHYGTGMRRFADGLSARLSELAGPEPGPTAAPIDYLALYRRDRAGRRALRARVRARR